jgi:hypothetical protein
MICTRICFLRKNIHGISNKYLEFKDPGGILNLPIHYIIQKLLLI